jgi:hypothetical protein
MTPRAELIVKYWRAGGLTASEIAERVSGTYPGTTRNAVLGTIHRLREQGEDLERRGVSAKSPKPNRAPRGHGPAHPWRKEAKARGDNPNSRVARARRRAERKPVAIPAGYEMPDPDKGLTIIDLQHFHCRNIGEDNYYCGQPRLEGSSYCDAHHKLNYRGFSKITPKGQRYLLRLWGSK